MYSPRKVEHQHFLSMHDGCVMLLSSLSHSTLARQGRRLARTGTHTGSHFTRKLPLGRLQRESGRESVCVAFQLCDLLDEAASCARHGRLLVRPTLLITGAMLSPLAEPSHASRSSSEVP